MKRLKKNLGEDKQPSSDPEQSSDPSAREGAQSRYPLRDQSKVPFTGSCDADSIRLLDSEFAVSYSSESSEAPPVSVLAAGEAM